MYVSSVPDHAQFDFIVVGSGSAGCAVANRLTADGSHSVLLLEAGGRDTNYNIHIPLMVANVLNDTRWTWPYMTEPQTHLNGQKQKWARGRVIGGSSSVNGNLFVRGDPAEYDNWRDQGCRGWGYSDLLPIFKRLEDYPQGDPAVRGRGGPIHCTNLENFDPLSNAFVGACEQAGYRRLKDYNDGSYEGAFHLQYSTRNGLRNSAAAGYLRPALKRPNLTVLPNATAARVLMDGKRATGVEYRHGAATLQVRARREVVLSAGPLASPQLLELSGIGNSEILEKHGVSVVHHLPGVGENLRDHPNTRLTFECSQPITINDVLQSPWLKLKEGLRFLLKREGLLHDLLGDGVLMVVNPSMPVASIRELIALARARPGQVNFATGGIGSSPHMSMELFKSVTRIDMVPIHYKGDGAAIIDVVGGQVPMLTSSMSALMPYVKSGKLRGVAVTSLKRSTVAPEFPTIAESGLEGFEVITWFGILVPAATPKEIVNRLNTEIVQAVASPNVREQLTRMGFEIVANTPEQYAVFLREENVKWGNVVKNLGLRAE